jgi:hypothetical protein
MQINLDLIALLLALIAFVLIGAFIGWFWAIAVPLAIAGFLYVWKRI